MGSYVLPPLPYPYNGLEPYISEEIMTLHHTKHHQTYVNAFNAATSKYEEASSEKERIALQATLKFNEGGHINHSLFWKNLEPHGKEAGGALPNGILKTAIEKDFVSLEKFQEEFNIAALGIQGSGWCWLGLNPTTRLLEIATTPNQDPLLHLIPLIGVDMWEHAFYLQYRNVKVKYLDAIWKVINFKEAQRRYEIGANGGDEEITVSNI